MNVQAPVAQLVNPEDAPGAAPAGGNAAPPPPADAGGAGAPAPEDAAVDDAAPEPGDVPPAEAAGGVPGGVPAGAGAGPILLGAGAPAGQAGQVVGMENLMEAYPTQPFEVAYALQELGKKESWADALAPLRATGALADDYTGDDKLREFKFGVRPPFLLMVVDAKIQLVMGLRACTALGAAGTRVAALLGERLKHGEAVMEPRMMVLGGAIAHQGNYFGPIELRLPEWDDIRAAARNDEGAEQAADGADVTVVPRFLQVSAKLAWPFVRGKGYAESLEWFDKLKAAAPTTGGGAIDAGIVAMETFFRAAVTVDDAGEPLIEAPWRAQAMDAEATLLWHSECAGSFAPRAVLPLVEAGPRLDGQLPANTVRRMDERMPPRGRPQVRFDDEELEPQRTARKRYEGIQLQSILAAMSSPRGRTHDHLGAFWDDLRQAATKADRRTIVEDHIRRNLPSYAEGALVVFTTETIDSLFSARFNGNDRVYSFGSRALGWGYCSFPPVGHTQTAMADAENRRLRFEDYESTEDRHDVSDATNLRGLNKVSDPLPTTRLETNEWLTSFAGHSEAIFGGDSRLLVPFRSMVLSLKDPRRFPQWSRTEWEAFNWRIHIGTREFFRDERTLILDQLTSMLGLYGLPDPRWLPPDLRRNKSSEPSSRQGPPDEVHEGRGEPAKSRKVSSDIADWFTRDLEGLASRTGRNIHGGLLAPNNAAAIKLFGPDIMRCAPEGQIPCPQYWIVGGCRDPCPQRRAHALARQPSRPALQAFARRVRDKINTIKPASKNS